MCGCNKNKTKSASCKKYISRITSAKVKLLLEAQSTANPIKKSEYEEMASEISSMINSASCPKLSVVQAVENFISNEFN